MHSNNIFVQKNKFKTKLKLHISEILFMEINSMSQMLININISERAWIWNIALIFIGDQDQYHKKKCLRKMQPEQLYLAPSILNIHLVLYPKPHETPYWYII